MPCTSSNQFMLSSVLLAVKIILGKQETPLRHRMTVHRQQIREPKYQCILVSEHIRNYGVNKNPNLTVIPFYKFK